MWRKSKMDKTLDTKEQAFLKEHVEIVKNQKKPVNRIWKAWWIRTSNRWKSTKTNLKRRKLPYLKSSMIQPNTQQVRCNQSFFLINKGLKRVMTIKNCWNKVMVMLWNYQKYNANIPIWRNSLRMLHWILHQNNKKLMHSSKHCTKDCYKVRNHLLIWHNKIVIWCWWKHSISRLQVLLLLLWKRYHSNH